MFLDFDHGSILGSHQLCFMRSKFDGRGGCGIRNAYVEESVIVVQESFDIGSVKVRFGFSEFDVGWFVTMNSSCYINEVSEGGYYHIVSQLHWNG